MSEPVVAQKAPYPVDVEEGKNYFWCACGKSTKQPFCDGSHEGTDFLPEKVSFEENDEVYFCGCKQSKKGAFCDGSHQNL